MTTLQVAELVGLSATPCGRRIKRLEDGGVIKGYKAEINPIALGLNLCVLVTVRLDKNTADAGKQFLAATRAHKEITECILVTGDIDYLLRIWVKDVDALRDFILKVLQAIPAVAATSTMVVLDVPKSTDMLEQF